MYLNLPFFVILIYFIPWVLSLLIVGAFVFNFVKIQSLATACGKAAFSLLIELGSLPAFFLPTLVILDAKYGSSYFEHLVELNVYLFLLLLILQGGFIFLKRVNYFNKHSGHVLLGFGILLSVCFVGYVVSLNYYSEGLFIAALNLIFAPIVFVVKDFFSNWID